MPSFPKLPPYTILPEDADLWGVGLVIQEEPRPPAQLRVLEYMQAHPGWHHANSLAQALGNTVGSLSGILRALAKRGLIQKCPKDWPHVMFQA